MNNKYLEQTLWIKTYDNSVHMCLCVCEALWNELISRRIFLRFKVQTTSYKVQNTSILLKRLAALWLKKKKEFLN